VLAGVPGRSLYHDGRASDGIGGGDLGRAHCWSGMCSSAGLVVDEYGVLALVFQKKRTIPCPSWMRWHLPLCRLDILYSVVRSRGLSRPSAFAKGSTVCDFFRYINWLHHRFGLHGIPASPRAPCAASVSGNSFVVSQGHNRIRFQDSTAKNGTCPV